MYGAESFIKNGEWDLAEWWERLTVNVKVATILGSISASSDTVKSEVAAEEALLNNVHKNEKSKNPKIPL